MANTPPEPAYLDLAKHRPPLGWPLQRRHFQWQTFPLGHGTGAASSGESTPDVQPLRQAAQLVGLPPELGDGSGFSNFVDDTRYSGPLDLPVIGDFDSGSAQVREIFNQHVPSEDTGYPGPLNPPILGDFEFDLPQADGTTEAFNRQSLFEENPESIDSPTAGTQDIARKEDTRDSGPLNPRSTEDTSTVDQSVDDKSIDSLKDILGQEATTYSGPQTPKPGGFESGLPQVWESPSMPGGENIDVSIRGNFNQNNLFEASPEATGNTSTVDQPVDHQPIDSVKSLSLDGQPPSPLQRQPLGQRPPLGFSRPVITTDATTSDAMAQRLPNIRPVPSPSSLDASEQSRSDSSDGAEVTESESSQPDVVQPVNDESVTAVPPTEASAAIQLSPDLPLEQDSISDMPMADAVQQLPIETAPEAEPPIDAVVHSPADILAEPVNAIDSAPTESSIKPTLADNLSDTVQSDSEPSFTSPLPLSPEQLSPAPEPDSPDSLAVTQSALPSSELTIPPQSLPDPPALDTVSLSEPAPIDETTIHPKPTSPETGQPTPTQPIPEQSSDLAVDTPTVSSLPETVAQLRLDQPGLEKTEPAALPHQIPSTEEQHGSDSVDPSSLQALPNQIPSTEEQHGSDSVDPSSLQALPKETAPQPTETPDERQAAIPQDQPPEMPSVSEPLPPELSVEAPDAVGQTIQTSLLSEAVTQPLGRHQPMFDGLQATVKEQPSVEVARSQVKPTFPTIQAKQVMEQPSEQPLRPLSSKLVSLRSAYGLSDELSEPWLESAPRATLETDLDETPVAKTAETVSLSVTQALAEMAENNTTAHISSGEDEDQALWQLAHLLYSELRKDWLVRSHISDNFQRASPALMPIQSHNSKHAHLPLTLWPPTAHQLVTTVKQQLTIRLRHSHRRAQPSTLRRPIT
ncbi:hypothetical protein N836_30365 [Leptolyngbya sp. Heron Island J]|uniref:hypothetical protein n=1 Tax=Leptolyngbya sp. Heron Island J TaxID=1385935 RepID=UPI0003B99292|nr:hypothetical protein [Leptolyngbya sp. Heron Island J]ESA38834.1 hypothetical protein N836_30365 [Leptolyngbya sp. Heron Island J]